VTEIIDALPHNARDDLRHLYAEAVDSARESDDRQLLHQYAKALHDAGWTLEMIGSTVGVTRECVRLWINKAQRNSQTMGQFRGNDLPEVPQLPGIGADGAAEILGIMPASVYSWRKKRWVPEPDYLIGASPRWEPQSIKRRASGPTLRPQVVDRMRELHSLATTCRGTTPIGSPVRGASIELAGLIDACMKQGISAYRIAKELGITQAAVYFRLIRFGYRDPYPSMLDKPEGTQKYLGRQQSIASGFRDRCSRGHEMSGDNLYVVKGYPVRRQCRACNRIRYHECKTSQRAS